MTDSVDREAEELITPEEVVPFQVDRDEAVTALRTWVTSRRFIPARLRKIQEIGALTKTFFPHWAFTLDAVATYRGERGEHYWALERHQTRANNRTRTELRRVLKTRWRPASGAMRRRFDDVLVSATTQFTLLQMERLAPWPLTRAVPWQPDRLVGCHTPRYDIAPEERLGAVKIRLGKTLRQSCYGEIGGDTQRLHSVDIRYSNVTHRLVLLPVWVAHYGYAGKSWQALINGVTGEVIGKRPYSLFKIALAVVAALLLGSAIVAGISLIS